MSAGPALSGPYNGRVPGAGGKRADAARRLYLPKRFERRECLWTRLVTIFEGVGREICRTEPIEGRRAPVRPTDRHRDAAGAASGTQIRACNPIEEAIGHHRSEVPRIVALPLWLGLSLCVSCMRIV